jgi:hypothetical protein
MLGEAFLCIRLQPILRVHHIQIMHDAMSKEYALWLFNKAFNNCYNPHIIC